MTLIMIVVVAVILSRTGYCSSMVVVVEVTVWREWDGNGVVAVW